jgi:hypothetical protein
VVTDGKTLQIPQALATTQDSQHGHQQQIPGWKPKPTPHPRIWDRPQVADQVEINCGRSAVQNKEDTFPPTKLTSPTRPPVTEFESAPATTPFFRKRLTFEAASKKLELPSVKADYPLYLYTILKGDELSQRLMPANPSSAVRAQGKRTIRQYTFQPNNLQNITPLPALIYAHTRAQTDLASQGYPQRGRKAHTQNTCKSCIVFTLNKSKDPHSFPSLQKQRSIEDGPKIS